MIVATSCSLGEFMKPFVHLQSFLYQKALFGEFRGTFWWQKMAKIYFFEAILLSFFGSDLRIYTVTVYFVLCMKDIFELLYVRAW